MAPATADERSAARARLSGSLAGLDLTGFERFVLWGLADSLDPEDLDALASVIVKARCAPRPMP